MKYFLKCGEERYGPYSLSDRYLAGLVVYAVGQFKIAAAMEQYDNSVENIGLKMSGAMTLFFGSIYIQYHINRIHIWKKTGVLS